MHVSINSKRNMDDIKCDEVELKECFFRLDIGRLLNKLNFLTENSDRLKGSIDSIRYDIDSLESKLGCIKNDIRRVKHDMKSIESFLLIRIRHSSEYISMCCKCCLMNFRRKNRLW